MTWNREKKEAFLSGLVVLFLSLLFAFTFLVVCTGVLKRADSETRDTTDFVRHLTVPM